MVRAQGTASEPVELSPVTVYSTLVANQQPASSFATPVTALRYEPTVDVQSRNFAEIQADITIRGGTFENSTLAIGAAPIYDPQTGHYLAELPFSPAMLSAPLVRTGSDNAMSGWNGTAGSVAYGLQPVRTGGYVTASAGDNDLFRSELYSGYRSDQKIAGRTLAADASVASSESDGVRTFGDHKFVRYNARLQLSNDVSQTDLVWGEQEKKFGWPNMYAARNFTTPIRNEREDVENQLLMLNHKVLFGAEGDYFQVGGYLRRNEDHYAIPVLSSNSYHTTDVQALAFDGRQHVAEKTALIYRGGVIADSIGSTTLKVGPSNGYYNDRTQIYAGLFGEQTFEPGAGRSYVVTAGANQDDSNRDAGRLSPSVKLSTHAPSAAIQEVYLSYSESSQLPSYTSLNNNNSTGLFIGNRNLDRTVTRNVELGAATLVQGWSLKAATFYRHDDDLVDWIYNATTLNTPGLTSRRAIAETVDTIGTELFARRDFKVVELVFGYTFLHKFDNLAPTSGSFYALDYAEHRATVAAVVRLSKGLELRVDNEYRIQADNALRRGTQEPFFTSAGLYYAVPRVKGLSVFAQVDNVWNTHYEEVPLVPGSVRDYSFGARYAW